MALDQWLSFLGGAVGASVVGVLGALLAAWLLSKREHSKWLRDRRHEAYRDFLAAADKWAIRLSQKDDDGDDPPEFFDEMTAAEAAVELAGPKEVVDAMDPIRAHILNWGHRPDTHRGPYATEYWKLERAFVAAAKRGLRVKVFRPER